MKNKGLTITLIVLLSILVVGIIVFLTITLTKNKGFNFHFSINEYKEVSHEEQYENVFEKIIIDNKAGNIAIKNTNEDNIKIVTYSEEEDIKIEKTDTELKIINKTEGCKGFCFTQKIAKIEIYLPSSFDKELNIDSDYGNIEIEKFPSLITKIELDAGTIDIDEIKSGDIINKFGDIKINQIADVIIDEDAGSIKIDSVTNKLKIKQSAGDVKITNLNINEDSEITNDFGSTKIEKTNGIKIEAHTDLGSVKVNNSNDDATVKLTIENDCGDIKVNN